MTFNRLLVGLIGIPLGVVIIIYRMAIREFIGRLAWAEKYLGIGGTWTAIVLIGIATSVLSFLWMMGTLQQFFYETLGPFFLPSS